MPLRRYAAAVLAMLLLPGFRLTASAEICGMSSRAEPASIVAVDAKGDVQLDDGRVLKPAGILWPGASAPSRRKLLQNRLATLLLGAPLAIDLVGSTDRWGRQAAQMFVLRGLQSPLWIQGQLLEDGLVQAWSTSGDAACRDAAREFEMLARDGRLGLWSSVGQRQQARDQRQTRSAGYAAAIVFEGIVHSVRRGRSMTFVNFVGPRSTTPSWFVPQRLERNLAGRGHNLALLAGKRLRLQAEINYLPRPRLYVANPEAVYVLE